MIATTDRLVIYIDVKKKRQLSAILASKGQKLPEFFGEIIDDIVKNEKSCVMDLFKKEKTS